jgi:hypothetical protein
MRATTAAGYCDEPSVDSFLSKVGKGIYSAPVQQHGCLPKWHRSKLDQDIARRHGLLSEGRWLTASIEDLV